MTDPRRSCHLTTPDPWLILPCLGPLALYLLTLARIHTYDALAYAYSAEVGTGDTERLFYPHHLGYHLFARCYFWLWQFFGWEGRSMVPLQILSALASSLCLGFLCCFLMRVTSRSSAIAITLLLAISNGYWLYSTEVEVYTLSLLFLVLVFCAQNLLTVGPRQGLIVGLLWGCSILAHQTNVLFMPVILIALLRGRESEQSDQIQLDCAARVSTHFRDRCLTASSASVSATAVLAVTVSAMLTVAVPYLIAIDALQLDSPRAVYHWATWLVQVDMWGKLSGNSLLLALEGLRNTLFASPNSITWHTSVGTLIQIVGLAVFLGWVVWRSSVTSLRLLAQCLAWLTVYGAFFVWWEPGNVEFWIAVVPPFVIMLAIASSTFSASSSKRFLISVVMVLVIVGWSNWNNSVRYRLDAASDQHWQDMMNLVGCIPRDVVVVANTAMWWPWIVYYGGNEVHVLTRYVLNAERDSADRVADIALGRLRSVLSGALRSGRRVYWLNDPATAWSIMERNGIDKRRLETSFREFELIPLDCPFSLYELRARH